MDATILLVDGHHGVYTYNELVQRFTVYVECHDKYIQLASKLSLDPQWEGVDSSSVFHPDTEDWCENIDELEPLFVKDEDGRPWRVESVDGDLYAVNPMATWDESEDVYVLDGLRPGGSDVEG